MVIDPFRGQLLSGGNRISLRVSTGFLIEIITGLFYSVKLPKLALYQAELRPDGLDYFTLFPQGCQGGFWRTPAGEYWRENGIYSES